jgi:hypothetical protein
MLLKQMLQKLHYCQNFKFLQQQNMEMQRRKFLLGEVDQEGLEKNKEKKLKMFL